MRGQSGAAPALKGAPQDTIMFIEDKGTIVQVIDFEA